MPEVHLVPHLVLLANDLDLKIQEVLCSFSMQMLSNKSSQSISCLNTMGGGGREPKVMIGDRIRKLTAKECWRLQGFPDTTFRAAEQVNSNSQLYKQAGNSVTVSVIKAIAERL